MADEDLGMQALCDSMRKELVQILADPKLSKDQKHAHELATEIVLRIENIPQSTQMDELEIMLVFSATVGVLTVLYTAIAEEEFEIVDESLKAFGDLVDVMVKDANAHLN